MTVARVLDRGDWETWRDLRLRALQESPSAFGATYDHERAFTREQWRERLGDPESVSVLAEEGGEPLGISGGYQDLPGLLHVVAMWVAPPARGRGVSHALLVSLRGWAADRGLRLHLDVNTVNVAARRSYERFGFVVTGETRPLRAGSDEVVERMTLS